MGFRLQGTDGRRTGPGVKKGGSYSFRNPRVSLPGEFLKHPSALSCKRRKAYRKVACSTRVPLRGPVPTKTDSEACRNVVFSSGKTLYGEQRQN